ncbi:MAG: hypothetical protein QY317_16190 [Candidatus Jettenia caeni]|nr:MAG: hypothetical protein QY317_16190 [Candidatus Jettenia caeni]
MNLKIKALRGFGLGGGRFMDVGDVLEVSEAEALQWAKKGKVEIIEAQNLASVQQNITPIQKEKTSHGVKKK